MASARPVLILFTGFASSKLWWEYAEENGDIRKIDFLAQLKTIGDVFAFNQRFFAIDYHDTPTKNKEKWAAIYAKKGCPGQRSAPFNSNISFTLADLDYKVICEKTHARVKAKYGADRKYIVLGHSYGGGIALLFAKLYKSDVVLCVSIDNPPYVLSFYKKHGVLPEWLPILEKYKTDAELRKTLDTIRANGPGSSRNISLIKELHSLIMARSCQDRVKYYDKKLHTPTIFFRAHYPKPFKAHHDAFNKNSKKEEMQFASDKSLIEYVRLTDANHFIWFDQRYSDVIIGVIKKALYTPRPALI